MAFNKGNVPWNAAIKKIEMQCAHCNRVFYVKPSRISQGAKYCSTDCYHKNTRYDRNTGKHWSLTKEQKIAISERQLGEKNHQWKGGITEDKRTLIHRRWLRRILKRDNNMCRLCNNSGFVAHHLYSYNHYKNLRFELSNGITLCENCHQRFHKYLITVYRVC